ncbi:MAG: hypothetical protein NT067_02625 [Candidatus Diapherotrites archaeon]|nr:hypothetical protein [Candidatus Diapherotrites archaeon]
MSLEVIIALRKLRQEVEKGNKLKEKEIQLLEEIKECCKTKGAG